MLPECAAKLGVKSWNEMQVIMVRAPVHAGVDLCAADAVIGMQAVARW